MYRGNFAKEYYYCQGQDQMILQCTPRIARCTVRMFKVVPTIAPRYRLYGMQLRRTARILQCSARILPRKRPDDIAMCCKNVAIYVRNSTVLQGSARTRDYATTRDFCRCIARMSRLCNNSLGGYCSEGDGMMYYCNFLQTHRENIEFEI